MAGKQVNHNTGSACSIPLANMYQRQQELWQFGGRRAALGAKLLWEAFLNQ
jgi:hypothetical protein